MGARRLTFASPSDSAVAAYDRITDFSHAEGDRIDLSQIDANPFFSGDQAFFYIGAANFHRIAGELRLDGGFLQGDLNGDTVADFRIAVNAAGLVAADFIL